MILVTGAAGFIGAQVARALLARGDAVLGVDNLNDYYDVALEGGAAGAAEASNGLHSSASSISPTATACWRWPGNFPESPASCIWRPRPGVRYSLINPLCLCATPM